MKQIILSERLKTVASYIGQGTSVADIGTDHGYLPVYLAQNHIARRIVAADIKTGPLMRARLSAREYGVEDRIAFVLTDGLEGLQDHGIDTIVLAGMGGETIAGILARAEWTHSDGVRLILQPQSKVDELLCWLPANGYQNEDASLALDDGRIYTVLLASAGKGGGSEAFYKRLLDKREPLLPAYLAFQIAKARRAVGGLEKSRRASGAELEAKRSELVKLLKLREETEKWQQ